MEEVGHSVMYAGMLVMSVCIVAQLLLDRGWLPVRSGRWQTILTWGILVGFMQMAIGMFMAGVTPV